MKTLLPDQKKFIDTYVVELKRALNDLDVEKIGQATRILLTAYKLNKTVFIVGNGGSAGTASHMACDLGKGTLARVRDAREKRFRVISLTDNIPLVTAYANDVSYEDIFAQQLQNLLEKGDVVIALSGSGNSKNVIKAINYAKRKHAKTIGLLGFRTGGVLAKKVDVAITASSNYYGPCEDIQLILNHILSAWIAKVKYFYTGGHHYRRVNKAIPFQ